jgi:D-glycerate 3-kinase
MTMASDSSLHTEVALPLLAWLENRLAAEGRRRPPLILLNGPVGAGKTTLGRMLEDLAAARGIRLAVASIDDAYLPLAQRRSLLEGNPFGVLRVPPGSHDVPLLVECLERWQRGDSLRLPRFDKTLAGGQGDRSGWRESQADAVLIEGWLMGCRPLGPERLATALSLMEEHRSGSPLPPPLPSLSDAERSWLPRWDLQLEAYLPLWALADGLWILRPASWSLPRRWRFQAEARQRHAGGGWLPPADLHRLVRASLCSLPPPLYQDPLLHDPVGLPVLGVTELDGRRRCRPLPVQLSSSASSEIG